MPTSTTTPEPDFQTASSWWPDLPNIWTPLGWNNHLCRFNILWNGTILAKPDMNRRTQQYAGQGLQLAITPNYTEDHNNHSDWTTAWLRHDDGMVNQGWLEDDAPVLWTEWSKDGLLLRCETFAHIPGGGDVKTGNEPLFAWVRLRIHDLCSELPLEKVHGFNLFLQAPHVITTMSTRDNIRFLRDQASYPRPLRAAPAEPAATRGCRIIEPDGNVRMAVAPSRDCRKIVITPPTDPHPWTKLHVQLPARKGAFVDLLVPMLPCPRKIFDAELGLTFDRALAESRKHWKRVTASPTRFITPDVDINDILHHSVRFSNVLSEKNPATGKYCKTNGSWTYSDLWTTPGAMDLVMMMDTLGHHATVEKYLDIFREEQGTVVPPGPAYESHPGFLSTPALYKSIDWLSDNGAILWTICQHALLSGDKGFTERFTDCIVRSCDWMKSARAKKGHGGYEGVLPAAVATDNSTKIQATWSVGWNYKGLCAAVTVLQQIGHPRADEFAEEARQTRADFLTALRHKCREMPTWRDPRGKKHVLVPTSLAGEDRAETRHAFYLDTGPLFLVFAGLMDADDPLMAGTRAWFREGPQRRLYRRDSNCWQVPFLDHEMSSCEPCYSWNIFHSWQLGDRARFLEGLYSLFAGSISRKTRISCETRGGVTGTVFAAPLAIYLARLAVIDDELADDELHLLRLIPSAWLRAGQEAAFEKIPTRYGPVTLNAKVSRDGRTLDVAFRPAWRQAPPKVIFHAPLAIGINKVRLNGKPIKFSANRFLLPK